MSDSYLVYVERATPMASAISSCVYPLPILLILMFNPILLSNMPWRTNH